MAVSIQEDKLIANLLDLLKFENEDSYRHGLINFKDTKTKCRLYWCLFEFVDWRYSHSCWYF
jgi:hypothetical protein